MSQELAAVLDGLRSEGELNSSGVFTVDLTRALPKLEKFQLPKPHFGLLKIIQSAVVAGAEQINTSFSTGSIKIEHDGAPPSPEQMRQLLSFLMAPDLPTDTRALRDLAIGINTTLARGASWVELSVREEGEWVRQRWLSRQEVEESKVASSGSRGMNVSFVMRRTLGQAASQAFAIGNKNVGDLLARNRDSLDEDSRAVYDRCRHAPVRILIDGRPLPPSMFGKIVSRRWDIRTVKEHRRANLLDIFLACDEASPHLLSPPTGSEPKLKFIVPGRLRDGKWEKTGKPQLSTTLADISRRCFAVFGIRSVASVPGTITLVKDGVDLTTLAPPILRKGVTTILSAEGLPLDLSHFRLISGPQIQERLNWTSVVLAEIMGDILSEIHFDDCHESERQHLINLASPL